MGGKFSEEEIAAVQSKYPRLGFPERGVCRGILDLHARFRDVERRDEFNIEIIAATDHPGSVPRLREIGGRTQRIAEKYGLTEIGDLHQNSRDGSACVCVKQEEARRFPPGSELFCFVEELAVPYLFGISFFDENGKWPWAEYSHGTLSIVEFCGDNAPSTAELHVSIKQIQADENWREYSRQIRKPSAMRKCVCGSGKPFLHCHRLAWYGITKLHDCIAALGLNQRSYLQKQRP
ncbi:MAG TPA: hypothetical protein VHU18_06085 [Rhizomicrobium sp.]|jgi:hypothetical protein|nr:hypothetical protein [Rhizomicrobium sp.]